MPRPAGSFVTRVITSPPRKRCYHLLLVHKRVPTTSNCRKEIGVGLQKKVEQEANVVRPEDQQTIEKCKLCGKNVWGTVKMMLEYESRCRHEVESWGK